MGWLVIILVVFVVALLLIMRVYKPKDKHVGEDVGSAEGDAGSTGEGEGAAEQ
jgi:hypothetical protein